MPLRILHLSDIHFHVAAWNADLDVHGELIPDVISIVEEDGPIDAILVGGDIAFGGKAHEFQMAATWLDAVRMAAGGLDESRVWTVPGNHDVDWETVSKSPIATKFRSDLDQVEPKEVDDALNHWVQDPCSDGLIRPLEAYNDFARPFNCAVHLKNPHWSDRSLSVDGVAVQLSGLNSVLNSSEHDKRGDLILGSYQSQLSRTPPAIRIAMVHHPPSWIKDWDVVQPFMRRAHVLFFGHEHEFIPRQPINGSTVEISAGAVTPEREREGPVDPWVPSYNIVTLTCGDSLLVEVHPRKWDIPRSRFTLHPEGRRSFVVDLDPAVEDLVHDKEPMAEPVDASPLVNPRVLSAPDEAEATNASALRLLATRFMNLATTEKLSIVRELGVLEDADEQRTLDDVFPELLERVRERELVAELRRLVGSHGNL
jgi:hypothetical protein